MKLVEILARELGEWPSCDFIVQDDNGRCWPSKGTAPSIFDDGNGWATNFLAGEEFYLTISSDHSTAIVTREMWEAERARIKNVEWDGQGLPEPGADIEFFGSEKVWRAGKYIGMLKEQIIVSCKETGAIGAVARENIRPAKSKAEKERQAAIQEMMETVCQGTPWTLSADAAAKLYDAGYRKIVASKYSDLL